MTDLEKRIKKLEEKAIDRDERIANLGELMKRLVEKVNAPKQEGGE